MLEVAPCCASDLEKGTYGCNIVFKYLLRLSVGQECDTRPLSTQLVINSSMKHVNTTAGTDDLLQGHKGQLVAVLTILIPSMVTILFLHFHFHLEGSERIYFITYSIGQLSHIHLPYRNI